MTPPDGTSRVPDRQARGHSSAHSSAPREDRVALFEHEIEPEELGHAGRAVGAAAVLEFLEIDQPIVEREADDGAPRDLRLDAGAQKCGRTPRVDAPFVPVARNPRSA